MDENVSGAFDEQQYIEEMTNQLNAKLSAMSDDEFFALLESVDKEKTSVRQISI